MKQSLKQGIPQMMNGPDIEDPEHAAERIATEEIRKGRPRFLWGVLITAFCGCIVGALLIAFAKRPVLEGSSMKTGLFLLLSLGFAILAYGLYRYTREETEEEEG